MRISKIELKEKKEVIRAQARVTWEDTKRDDVYLFFETNKNSGTGFWPDPNAFLIAAYLPAWKRGEKRVHVDGALCPWLCDNMKVALTVLCEWYSDLGEQPRIDAENGFKALNFGQSQAVSFLSGGIDSLATLYSNKKLLPEDHPSSIRAVIPIHYHQWKHPRRTIEENKWRAEKRIRMAQNVAEELGVDVLPVETNVLNLYPDGQFYSKRWIGAILGSISHLFSKRFNKAYIASGSPIIKLLRYTHGTHPFLDDYYSSGHLTVKHHGLHMDRYDKIKLISEWQTGLQNIFVCEGRKSGENNCGRCEKCIRTMVVLAALNKLKDSSFPVEYVSPERLKTLYKYNMIKGESYLHPYKQVIPILREADRLDLANALNQVIDSWYEKHK
jgi:7-cyano-7-deazaguanine synthase in queuosine biosynthesis